METACCSRYRIRLNDEFVNRKNYLKEIQNYYQGLLGGNIKVREDTTAFDFPQQGTIRIIDEESFVQIEPDDETKISELEETAKLKKFGLEKIGD